ncbi:GNAT family N-acetyltransferase [Flavobacterium humi]|uniref:N-acetyltransferase n=1 Tax=Flavobacterium humi TaxID=2562683 RepID=A0A4Z0L6B4_9FLAO|nr:GNAT family N-acetyltransferase [Flavobacterium humi]TGD57255.1 N-acetyltransferase [Flavobacterium humi]
MSNSLESKLVLNEEKKRFELEVEGKTAFIEFILSNENIMFLTHTEVPGNLEGKGVGSAIVSKTLEYLKEKGYTLAPLCPFVAAYVKRHPQWKEILAKGYNV